MYNKGDTDTHVNIVAGSILGNVEFKINVLMCL